MGACPDTPPPPPEPTEEQRVYENVRAYLVELGFTEADAKALAAAHADWHEAQHLIAEGCPHPLVVDILL